MTEQIRTETQPLVEAYVTDVAAEMGETPVERLEWFMNQNQESFGTLLITLNATARGIDPQAHSFDGEGVKAGTVGASVPPDQEDKVTLMSDLLSSSQNFARERVEEGDDPEEVLLELAMAVPTMVNKLHMFGDGNGRTSRLTRLLLRDGNAVTPDKLDNAIHKTVAEEKYDTTPTPPIENAVKQQMRVDNDTVHLRVTERLLGDDNLIDGHYDSIHEAFPDMDGRVINAYWDTFNFWQTASSVARKHGHPPDQPLELTDVLRAATDEAGVVEFLEAYRTVRYQRVQVLMEGLLGNREVPMKSHDLPDAVDRYVNRMRASKGQSPVACDAIRTIKDFQMAYEEAFSPDHQMALAA